MRSSASPYDPVMPLTKNEMITVPERADTRPTSLAITPLSPVLCATGRSRKCGRRRLPACCRLMIVFMAVALAFDVSVPRSTASSNRPVSRGVISPSQ